MSDVIYEAEGAQDCGYGCMLGLICIHVRASMGLSERVVMGLE